ncbi:MAG: protein translocase subunit SecF [Clostridia bacterium]|nr:protein translocase subunit SecF [Clostridia bacterium]
MFKKNIDFNKCFKPVLIGYAVFMVIGIILTAIFGVQLDINFKGGTRITYSYTGELDYKSTETLIEKTLDKEVNLSESSGLADDSKKIVITLVGTDSLSNEAQQNLAKVLTEEYKENTFELYDSNSVNPSVAGAFFAKSLAAVVLTGLLVILYVGIRFRKIGGVSAGLTAFASLFLDIFVAFFICNIFGLQIDSNFMAVILTILGYSLNDTIVVYDRIRENKGNNPTASTAELVNDSLNTVKVRTIITTITTLSAVVMIIVIAELFGLTSLRSFAIPMAFGLISGCISSLFVSAPLWVIWKNRSDKKTPKFAGKKGKKK